MAKVCNPKFVCFIIEFLFTETEITILEVEIVITKRKKPNSRGFLNKLDLLLFT